MLSYECIFGLIKRNGLDVADVSNKLQISGDGFKKAIRNCTLQGKYVIGLCEILKISPNELFEYSDNGSSVSISQSGLGNQQTNNLSPISALERQLDVKDFQIASLLKLLEK